MQFSIPVAALTLAATLAPGVALSAAPSNEELWARLQVVEAELAAMKQTATASPASANKLTSTTVTADSKGLLVASTDGRYSFGLTGTVHSDGRFFNGDHEPNNDTFL